MRFLKALVLLLVLSGAAYGKYPYDSVGRVSAGGTCTMIYVADGKGLMVTCAHVMEGESETKVYWPAVDETRVCKTVFVDKEADLAYLVCDNPPVAAVPIKAADSGVVVSAGFPYYERGALHWQIGIALETDHKLMTVTNRPVAGMSGGAGFDENGNLVGVVKQYNPLAGGLASGPAFITTTERFADPATWVPDASHVEEKKQWNLAKQNGDVRTMKYDEKTAPDLMPVL